MSIQNELDKIKNAVYGREVRGAIHDGIKKAYDDASEKDNANMEVKIARGTHPNLRSRLDETTAQLAHTTQELDNKTDKSIYELKVQKIDNEIQSVLSTLDSKVSDVELQGVANQIANIVAHNGDGTKDSELIDGRTDVAGMVFNSLKQRLDHDDNRTRNLSGVTYSTYNNENINVYITTGGSLHIEEHNGTVYVKHDSLALVGRDYQHTIKIETITWSEIKADLNDSSKFVTSPNGVEDCLQLKSSYDAYVYDLKNGKASVIDKTNMQHKDFIPLVIVIGGKLGRGRLVEINAYNRKEKEIESVDELPQWVTSELENTTERVKKKQSYNTLTFGYITDTHYMSVGNNIYRYGIEHNKYINEVSKRVGLDYIAHGGDFIEGYSEKNIALKDLEYNTRALIKSVNSPVVIMRGNHDDNTTYSHWNGDLHKHLVTPKEWYNNTVSLFKNDVVIDENNSMGGYFYTDNERTKIRSIFLNSSDIPVIENSDGTTKYKGIFIYGFQDKQINWLAETLEFIGIEDKEEWGVVIFSHVPLNHAVRNTGDNIIENGHHIEGIIQAFNDNDVYVGSTSKEDWECDVDVNYSNQTTDLIACVYGHTHRDSINKINGITHITTLNSLAQQSNESLPTRTVGTRTEDSWNIITIDRDKRKIYGHRFGVGEDFEVSY